MKPPKPEKTIPVLSVASFLRYVHQIEAVGAPIDRLLARSRIPAALLEHPTAALSREAAYRFGELACRTLGTEHLGLYVGLVSKLDDLGPYGEMLRSSLTIQEYLGKGIALYNMLNTGHRLCLSEHGEELLFRVTNLGDPGIGAYQTELETLVVTIAKIKDAVGPGWKPREIGLAYRAREELPDIDLFAGSRVLRGIGETYFTIPRVLMEQRFSNGNGGTLPRVPSTDALRPLPADLFGQVRLQIDTLVSDPTLSIDIVAETLGMSRRGLQRGLAQLGLTYSQLLADSRMHQAATWLQSSDKPIVEIAYALGYTDASNFTRAFRNQTGVSPQAFRLSSQTSTSKKSWK
jgi:AraC-like DNA-binding protein